MIEIINPNESSESYAAMDLQDMILATWPALKTDYKHDIKIIPNVKCYGEKREDIDILVMAKFGMPKPFFTIENKTIYVSSLCFVIEVKEHSLGNVRFTGNSVEVLYRNQWEDASNQNFEQMNSLREYLQRHDINAPFITYLLWLRNVPVNKLPPEPHNILGSTSKWEDFLRKAKTIYVNGFEEIRASKPDNQQDWNKAVSIFTYRMQPSRIDRQRMERISASVLTGQQYSEKLGEQLLIFTGRGGTGKTVRLIRLAYDLYQKQDARILILTYHKALVSDIKRLFALMNIRDGVGERSIKIQTVHSFIYKLLIELDLIQSPCSDFLDRYENYKNEALELMLAVTNNDISDLKHKQQVFNWDFILVDEAQDWPENERDLLFKVYDYKRFVLADGMIQFARNQLRTNWRANIDKHNSQIVNLKEIIRMKKNLSIFLKEFTQRLGLDSRDIQPYRFAEGGDIIIIEGPYAKDKQIHEELIKRNKDDGNEPIDMLFCLPPKLVKQDETGHGYSLVGEQFNKWGYKIWDGVASDIRESYPTDLNQLRLIQYDSCRGLEGWIVINIEFDQFYDYKLNSYMSLTDEEDNLLEDENANHEFAARWLIIPLTRAIDTLVIHVTNSDHRITAILRQISQKFSDFVEWRKITS